MSCSRAKRAPSGAFLLCSGASIAAYLRACMHVHVRVSVCKRARSFSTIHISSCCTISDFGHCKREWHNQIKASVINKIRHWSIKYRRLTDTVKECHSKGVFTVKFSGGRDAALSGWICTANAMKFWSQAILKCKRDSRSQRMHICKEIYWKIFEFSSDFDWTRI